MGISECAGTVKEVLRDLRKGKGLPTCKLVSSSYGGKAGATHVAYRRADYLPQCLEGMRDGVRGVYYHQGRRPDAPTKAELEAGKLITYDYISRLGFKDDRGQERQTTRVCVGGKDNGQYIHTYRTQDPDHDSRWRMITARQTHHWFEKVTVVTPDGADYEFDVTIDGKPHARHRFSVR